MALSPEDKKDVKGAMGKAMANKIDKVTNDRAFGSNVKIYKESPSYHHLGGTFEARKKRESNSGDTKLSRNTARLRAEGRLYKSSGMAPDSPFQNVTHINGKKIR